MADNGSDSELSGDEIIDNAGQFDLVQFNDNDVRRVEDGARLANGYGSDSDDESDFEGFEPEDAYQPPEFHWAKTENARDIFAFEEPVGPSRVFDTSMEPIEYFQLFYSDEFFAEILTCTNLNARRKREQYPDKHKGKWTDVTMPEIKAYYGVLLLMEVMKMDRDELYFVNSGHLVTKFGDIMPRDRFVQIKRYLHFSDDSVPNDDRLHKVRYVLNTCRHAFQREYMPHKHVSVDEAMIPFKGRLSMKQYMKDKPVKFGIKVWVEADAVTGYCLNFEVYIGKAEVVMNRNFGLASKVVIELTKHLHNKGHIVYTDNFYTSPQLAHFLFSQNTYLCGTVRTNRKGYPKQLIPTKAEVRRMERGQYDWLMSGPLVATCWMDNRLVYYLSSCHAPEEDGMTTSRRNKDGTARQLSATPTVLAYSQYMGGVDRLDQNSRMNKSKKSMRWYRKIEIKLREISLYNAFVIERETVVQTEEKKRKPDLLSFRLDVANALIGNFSSRKAFKRPRSEANEDARLDGMNHWPTAAGSADKLCVVCNKKHKNYASSHPGVSMKDNPFKRTKTTMACEKCQVALCCNARSSCYKDFHNKVYYWQ